MKVLHGACVLGVAASFLFAAPCLAGAILVDHGSTELSRIPEQWIGQVKKNVRVYYGHTSHGQQLVAGIETIESRMGKRYDALVYESGAPDAGGALAIRNNKNTYNPEDFFATVDGALAADPKINVVMYGWCSQPNGAVNWKELLAKYTSRMSEFERRYPHVTFVYMTAHSQRRDCEGCNRHQFNEALRSFCAKNGKVLFDFGDIDAWSGGRMSSYVSPRWCACAGWSIPAEHDAYGGGEGNGNCNHTNTEGCLAKGKATWWLLARIAGWNPGT